MKIILDFDDTILNTYSILEEIIKIFQRRGFTKEVSENMYKKSVEKAGNFDQEAMIDLLFDLKEFDRIKTGKEINYLLDRTKDFIYPDFFDFAKHFDKSDLIMVSFGAKTGKPVFQERKLAKSGIKPFFGKAIITSKDKIGEIEPIYKKYPGEKIFFIDDKAEQIDKTKTIIPEVIAMKMERPQGWHTEIKSKRADYVIKSLKEAEEIINQKYNKVL